MNDAVKVVPDGKHEEHGGSEVLTERESPLSSEIK